MLRGGLPGLQTCSTGLPVWCEKNHVPIVYVHMHMNNDYMLCTNCGSGQHTYMYVHVLYVCRTDSQNEKAIYVFILKKTLVKSCL